jgi:hypothetical protein
MPEVAPRETKGMGWLPVSTLRDRQTNDGQLHFGEPDNADVSFSEAKVENQRGRMPQAE